VDADGYIDYASALNERLGKGVEPEKNAAVLLWKALGPRGGSGAKPTPHFFRQLEMEPLLEKGDYFVEFDVFLKEQRMVDSADARFEIAQQIDDAVQRPWPVKLYPHLAAWLTANEKPLAILVAASKRHEFFSPWAISTPERGPGILSETFPLPALRRAATALVVRAMLALTEERPDDAWQDLVASHRLARLVTYRSGGFGMLTGASIEHFTFRADLAYLGIAKPNRATLQKCQRDIRELPKRYAMANVFELAERVVLLDMIVTGERHGVEEFVRIFSKEPLKLPDQATIHRLISWDTALMTANHWHSRIAAAGRIQDRAARQKLLDQLGEELQPAHKYFKEGLDMALLGPGKTPGERGKLLAELLTFSPVSLFQAVDRCEQFDRNLQLAFALAGYQRDHGKYPAKLDALAPDYLPQIPIDLFSGQAMIYRPTEAGYLLYSVGVNGKDDGGRTYGEDPPGGDDLVVRMPLPPLRK
jgi:hypothetical protein